MYCPKCGTELEENSVACFKCGKRILRGSRRKILLISFGCTVILVVGYLGLSHYFRLQNFKSKLEEAIGKDAGYTETIIKVEGEASSISYQELFELCEKSNEGRTNLIVELRGLYPDVESDLKNNLIDFLNKENDLVRQKAHLYRKLLALSSSLELYKDHLTETPSSGYLWSYYNDRTRELKSASREAAEEMKDAANAFIVSYRLLVVQEQVLKKSMDSEGLRFLAFFERYQEENLNKAQASIDLVQGISW